MKPTPDPRAVLLAIAAALFIGLLVALAVFGV